MILKLVMWALISIATLVILALLAALAIIIYEMRGIKVLCEKCAKDRPTDVIGWLPIGPHICGRCGKQFVREKK